MLITQISLALAIAIVMTILAAAICFTLGIRVRCLQVYAFLTIGTMGGGQVVVPVGPDLWGAPWLSFCLAGLLSMIVCLSWMLLSRQITIKISAHMDGLASANHVPVEIPQQEFGTWHVPRLRGKQLTTGKM